MKFCQFVASLYLHILSNFGRFINAGESYHKLRQKPEIPEFDLKMHFSWLGLAYTEKAIDNVVKDCYKRLQACVSANGEYFEHLMW